MGEDTVVELLDGSVLVLGERPRSGAATRELESWALIPEDVSDEEDVTRDPSVWEGAFEAGALLHVAFQGVVGNATWELFPAAARYLTALFDRREPALDAGAAAKRAREATTAACGLGTDRLAAEEVSRDGEGCWTVRLAVDDGRRLDVRLDPAGLVTHVAVVTMPS